MSSKEKDDIKRPEKDVRIDKESPKFKEVLSAFVKKDSNKPKN